MHILRPGLLLAASLAVAACSSERERTIQMLDDRMSQSLAPDLATGRATLQRQPDGVGVCLPDRSLFTPAGTELQEAGRNTLTRVIQALLDPNILRIEVAGTAATPGSAQTARAQAVTDYLNRANLGRAVQPQAPRRGALLQPPCPAVAGQGIAVRVISG